MRQALVRRRGIGSLSLAALIAFAGGDAHADEVDDLAPGTWFEIPNTNMREVCPPDAPGYDYSFFCRNVMAAWSGAVQDTARGRLLVWGGGHADYKGNEIYAFDMLGLQWERTWGPTPDAQIPTGGTHEVYDDGSAGSRHTYSGLGYLPPPYDEFVSFGGSRWQSGFISAATWRFSFADNTWTRGVEGEGQASPGDPTVYDPVTGHLFRRSNNRMLEYDHQADVFINRAPSDGGFYAADVATDLDLSTRTMVIVGDGRLDLYHLDTDVYEQDVTVQGPSVSDLFGGASPGVAYDPVDERIVVWGGGTDVYTFDPAGPSFLLHAGAGDDPGPPTASGGTFGRFRYAPSRNVFVAVHNVDSNVFVYRMSEGIGVPPDPPDDGETDGTDTDTETGDSDGDTGGTGGPSSTTASSASTTMGGGTASSGPPTGGEDSASSAASGTSSGEAGTASSTSGATDSAGPDAEGDDSDEGCTCTTTGRPAWAWLALFAVGLVRRRRDSRSRI